MYCYEPDGAGKGFKLMVSVQLLDICYNTLGGMIGGVMFWLIRLIRKQ